MATVYLITNTVNGKLYVGFTRRTTQVRFDEHVRHARSGTSFPLHAALRKYGRDCFTISVLIEDATEDDEMRMITDLGTLAPNGYNLWTGGIAPVASPETRKKLSDAGRGRLFSDQHRKRISQALKNARQRKKWGSPWKVTWELSRQIHQCYGAGILTQHELAALAEISRSSVQLIVSGKHYFSDLI